MLFEYAWDVGVSSINTGEAVVLLSTSQLLTAIYSRYQLDPPQSRLLLLKGASISFVNPSCFPLACAQQGRLLRKLSLVYVQGRDVATADALDRCYLRSLLQLFLPPFT